MNRDEALTEWVMPAIRRTWNEKKCDEILKALKQDPCDAVSRKAAIDACLKGLNRKEMVSNIKALPPVTPAEKVGKWVFVKGYEGLLYECTVCRNKNTHTTVRWNYCPHCGAKMQEVDE